MVNVGAFTRVNMLFDAWKCNSLLFSSVSVQALLEHGKALIDDCYRHLVSKLSFWTLSHKMVLIYISVINYKIIYVTNYRLSKKLVAIK